MIPIYQSQLFPINTDNSWVFESFGDQAKRYVNMITGDTLLDNTHYYIYYNGDLEKEQLLRKSSNQYFIRNFQLGDESLDKEILVLDRDVPPGATWSESLNSGNLLLCTIVAKEQEHTVLNQSFSNVTSVKMDVNEMENGQLTSLYSATYHYQLGKGIIHIEDKEGDHYLIDHYLN